VGSGAHAPAAPPAGRSVVVWSPGPILTITIERGDPCEIHVHPGGQGAWVTRMAVNLGANATLCAPFGGETGAVILELLRQQAVECDPTHTDSWNGSYVHDRRSGTRVEIARVDGAPLSRHEEDDLYGNTVSRAVNAGICVLTGITPPRIAMETYARLTRDLRANSVVVIADLSGPALRAALEGGVDVVKVSHEELLRDGWAQEATDGQLRVGAEQIRAAGARDVVVSHADQPTLALLGDEALRVAGPQLDAREPRGAGDSMTAALAAAMVHDLDPARGLALAVAAGALNATRRGLGTGERSRIEQLAGVVDVSSW
jgi:1-phosphofructokinase